jgi:hypothetical protein
MAINIHRSTIGTKLDSVNNNTLVFFFGLKQEFSSLPSLQLYIINFSRFPNEFDENGYPAWYKNGPAATCGLTLLRLNAVYGRFLSVKAINIVPLMAGSPS